MTHPTPEQEGPCDDGTLTGNHEWVEEYYGTRCVKCKTFYPHGCAPWDEEVREGFDFGDDSIEEDDDDEPMDWADEHALFGRM